MTARRRSSGASSSTANRSDTRGADAKPAKKPRVATSEPAEPVAALESAPSVLLKNSVAKWAANMEIPTIGFGTYRLKGSAVSTPLKHALEAGFEMLDTAGVYENEKQIGSVIRTWVGRGKDHLQPIVMTKLWRADVSNDPEDISARLDDHLAKLRIPSIGIWLLHWPGPARHMHHRYAAPEDWTPEMRHNTLRGMVACLNDGRKRVRAVGVSNFSVRQLRELEQATGIIPAVNQFELHPLCLDGQLLQYCRDKGIVVVAYNSLGEGKEEVLGNDLVSEIAARLGKTPAQVLLRWGVQHGAVVIPGSKSRTHIRENAEVFDFTLSTQDMRDLDALNSMTRFGWKSVDPDTVDTPDFNFGDMWGPEPFPTKAQKEKMAVSLSGMILLFTFDFF